MTMHIRLSGEPPMPPEDADFSFTIDFEKGAGDPRRIFDSASALIEGFELADEALVSSVDGRIKTLMVLEDVEAGSLKVWLKKTLDGVPDEAIKSFDWKKAVGHYLLKAKYVLLRFCDDETAGTAGLAKLRSELRELAAETDVRHLPDYAPIHEGRLVAALDQIQDAKRTLGPNDKLIIETDEKTYEVDLTKTWTPSDVIPVANVSETHSEGEMILVIRKPDMLGDSMWQFKHGKINVTAPIRDESWVADFRNKKHPIHPGDALRCRVRFTYVYDEQGALIEQKTEIIKVLDVMNVAPGSQGSLFDGKPN